MRYRGSHSLTAQNFTIGNHPAWASEIDLTTWTLRPLDIVTNSFCAGGGVTGNGSLVNVGGNNAICEPSVVSRSS